MERTKRPAARTPLIIATAAILALTATGCTGDPTPTPSPSPSPTIDTTPQGPYGDGQLRIGTLVPISGTDRPLALAQVAGVELAIRDINAAGGVNGQPVTVHHRDTGDNTSDTLETNFAELAQLGVDVIIGPSTLGQASRLAPHATDTGTLLITPAINDPALSAIDADGLLASTMPSATHDGAAIAAQLPPRARVALLYFSDNTGKGIRDSLASALPAAHSALVATIPLTPTLRDTDSIIDTITSASADTIIYAGSATRTQQNSDILTALSTLEGVHSLWLTSTVTGHYQLEPGTLDGALTISAGGTNDPDFANRLRSSDPRATTQRTAAEAYDAVILAALAATIAEDDGGRAIASHLADTSAHGIPCRSYAHCLHVLDTSDAWGNNIDYQGRSGPLDLTTNLTAAPGHYTVHRLDNTNTPQPTP